MSYYNGPKIVTDGLKIYWDVANSKSYPRSGSFVYDLCGNYDAVIGGSPTFSTSNGGILTFDGSTSYITNDGPNYSTTNCTVMGAAKYNGTNGRMINAASNNWLMGHWGNSVANYYAEGWVTGVGAGGSDNNWRIYTTLNNYSTDTWSFYINNTLNASNNGGSQGPNGLLVGRFNNGTEGSNGSFSFLLLYNRILTYNEISQNYNALRGRFSL